MDQVNFVSIIIPCYNAQEYIAETVQSVLGQSYENFELIIVNDGSKDNSLKVIETFSSDTRMRVIDQVNQGVNTARNNGYAESSGEYLCFLDADDVWTADRLRFHVDYMNAHPEVGLVHNDIEMVDQNSILTGQVDKGKEGWLLDDLLLWDSCCIPTPSATTLRRGVIETAGDFDPLYANASDQEFYFRVAKHFKIGRIPQFLTKYRMHDNNMRANMTRMEFDHVHAYKKSDRGGLFRSTLFKMRCFSNMYMILAFNFWIHGGKKSKALKYMGLSLINNPFNIHKPISKVFKIWK